MKCTHFPNSEEDAESDSESSDSCSELQGDEFTRLSNLVRSSGKCVGPHHPNGWSGDVSFQCTTDTCNTPFCGSCVKDTCGQDECKKPKHLFQLCLNARQCAVCEDLFCSSCVFGCERCDATYCHGCKEQDQKCEDHCTECVDYLNWE